MTQTAEHFAPEGAIEGARDSGAAARAPREAEDQTTVFRTVTGILRKRGGSLHAEKRDLLLRLLRRIHSDVDLSTRRDLARALARDSGADRGLIQVLLDDHAEIACPVIERSPALTVSDLLRIVSGKSAEHCRAVATRPGLPGEVADALVQTGDPHVLRTLLRNRRTRLPRSVFGALAAAARRHPELREPLSGRPELPADLARELSAETLQDAEKTAAALAAKLHRAGHLRASVLVGALRQKQIALFEHAFALLTGVPVAKLRNLLRDRCGFPLALAARAARMDRSAFSTVFVNYCEARGVSPRLGEADFARAMDVFRNLPQEGARAELHRLAGIPRPATPPQPFHEPLLQD
ncbi:MAG: DUF2336 domain-containing protein [Alphaproteobacteria bacterium]